VAEYGIHLTPWEQITNVDALILAVSHTAYVDMGVPKLLTLLRAPSDGVLIDVKACLDPRAIPPTIAYWRL
jgi:UDP-N-acetyl-D-galactosamine dehydrogenase